MIAKKVNMQKTLNLKKILINHTLKILPSIDTITNYYINSAFPESTLSDKNIPWVICSICISLKIICINFCPK